MEDQTSKQTEDTVEHQIDHQNAFGYVFIVLIGSMTNVFSFETWYPAVRLTNPMRTIPPSTSERPIFFKTKLH